MKIHHVHICITQDQENEARAFYGDILGLKELPKPETLKGRGGMWFELGENQLHIGVQAESVNHLTKAHIAYEVSNLDNIKKNLIEVGCEIKASIPIPGMERFETRDPFGNRLEFLRLKDKPI